MGEELVAVLVPARSSHAEKMRDKITETAAFIERQRRWEVEVWEAIGRG